MRELSAHRTALNREDLLALLTEQIDNGVDEGEHQDVLCALGQGAVKLVVGGNVGIGILQTALARWLGLWPGILAAGMLFGTVHLITLTYGILVTLVGIYLGWCYAASGNLLGVIVAHGLYDFLALAYLTRGPELKT